jgi:hypothetical protein
MFNRYLLSAGFMPTQVNPSKASLSKQPNYFILAEAWVHVELFPSANIQCFLMFDVAQILSVEFHAFPIEDAYIFGVEVESGWQSRGYVDQLELVLESQRYWFVGLAV